MEQKWFLSDRQSGFRKKDGTSLQLIRLVQQWSEAVDDCCYVWVIFFDLKKAFDKVWHDGLLAKLEMLGLRGVAFSWFRNYLAGRSQCTDVAGKLQSSRIFTLVTTRGPF